MINACYLQSGYFFQTFLDKKKRGHHESSTCLFRHLLDLTCCCPSYAVASSSPYLHGAT
jgi:hypothetical protein